MHAFYAGLGRFTVKFRWVIVLVWVFGTVVSVRALPSMSSQVNDQNTAFLPSNAPDVKAANLAAPLLGQQRAQAISIVAVSSTGSLSLADRQSIERDVRLVSALPSIDRVQPGFPSKNGKAVLVQALTSGAGFNPALAKTLLQKVQATFPHAGAPPGLRFHVAGPVADEVAQNAKSKTTGNATQGLSLIFIVVLLLFIFRSLLAPLITLLPAAFVLEVAGSIIGEIASHGVLRVSEVTQLLLIVIVLGAGTDYGLFLVYRVREGIRDGREPTEAVALAVARVGESITASAATVIIALLSLLLATFGIYHDLGIPLAIGITTMLLAGLTLLPALLAIFGRAAFWPSKPRGGQNQAGLWGRVAGRVVAKPVPTLVLGIALFGVLAAGVAFYTPAGFGGAVNAPKGSDAANGDAVMRANFSQSSANPTNLIVELQSSAYTDPALVEKATTVLLKSGLFTSVRSALNPSGFPISENELKTLRTTLGPPRSLAPLPPPRSKVPILLYESYRADAQYVSPTGRIVQFAAGLRAGDPGGNAALHEVPAIRAALGRAAAAVHAVQYGTAGEAAALYDISSTSDGDLTHIVPLAAIAIAILLALVLRSLVAPLYLIASVVLSYLAALGLSAIIFVKLGHSGGLTFLLPFLMFIFLLALGEDYNILVMTRIREEAHHHSLKEAVVRAVGVSGPTITSAGLVLAGTFAVLAFAGSQGPGGGQVKDIGVGLALGILMDTFLVRTLLVPSTVVLLGRLNWWPRHVEEGMGYPGTEEHHRFLHRKRQEQGGSMPRGSDL